MKSKRTLFEIILFLVLAVGTYFYGEHKLEQGTEVVVGACFHLQAPVLVKHNKTGMIIACEAFKLDAPELH